MKIGIIGATGNIGQRVLREAVERGHQVTGFTRDQRLSKRLERISSGRRSTCSTQTPFARGSQG
jgi:putative NADH-flavin reductase